MGALAKAGVLWAIGTMLRFLRIFRLRILSMALGLLHIFVLAAPLRAGEVTVAVAASFLPVAETLAQSFTAETGHDVALVHGATGRLTTQIERGAPFDVFLAADVERPAHLHQAGLTVEPPKPYALGLLALVRRPGADTDGQDISEILTQARWIAVADPAVAPYGRAALEALQRLLPNGLPETPSSIAYGENAGQVLAFVSTGNAPVGVVALAQARASGLPHLELGPALHAPIRQDAVLLTRAADNPVARTFLDYVLGAKAQAEIRAAGYGALPK